MNQTQRSEHRAIESLHRAVSPDHFRFSRTSGLPLNYFAPKPRIGLAVFWGLICFAAFACTFAMIWAGVK